MKAESRRHAWQLSEAPWVASNPSRRLHLKCQGRTLSAHHALEALTRVAAGEPLREIAFSYNVDHSTISRLKTRHAAEMV
jgi:hypothetical protein